MVSISTLCPICLTEVSAAEIARLDACGHACCVSCLRRYLAIQISRARLSPRCFHVDGATPCKAVVTAREITRVVVDAETLAKHARFAFNAANPRLGRQCPHCDHSQVCSDGETEPQCVCASCGQLFCFKHGNAHPQETCAQYERKLQDVDGRSDSAVKRLTRPCPECRVPIEKNGGCNHMTCAQCEASYCWICLKYVAIGLDSGQSDGICQGDCGQRTATALRHRGFDSLQQRAVYSVSLLLVGLPALFATVLVAVLTGGFYPCRRVFGLNSCSYFRLSLEIAARCIIAASGLVASGVQRELERAWDRFILN